MLSCNDKPPDIWNAHGTSGNVLVNPPASSSSPNPEGFNPWISNVTEHTSKHVMSERQKHQTQHWIRDASQDRQPDIRPTLVRELLQIIMEQTSNDCRFRIFILTNSLTQQHLFVGGYDSKTEVCTCSQFPTEAMLWINEVEMVESVDDLKSSCSI